MIWQGVPEFFTVLAPNDQLRLHDYFRPGEDLTDEQLEAHFTENTQARPNLAAAACQAFRKLERTYLTPRDQATGDPERWHAIMLQHTTVVTAHPTSVASMS